MLDNLFQGHIYIKRDLTLSETKTLLGSNFVNAIGHEGTVKLVNSLLGLDLKVNRANVKLAKNDIAVVVQVKERLEEGKVLNADEIMQLYLANKIQFDLVRVI
jgi:hypothetical protein